MSPSSVGSGRLPSPAPLCRQHLCGGGPLGIRQEPLPGAGDKQPFGKIPGWEAGFESHPGLGSLVASFLASEHLPCSAGQPRGAESSVHGEDQVGRARGGARTLAAPRPGCPLRPGQRDLSPLSHPASSSLWAGCGSVPLAVRSWVIAGLSGFLLGEELVQRVSVMPLPQGAPRGCWAPGRPDLAGLTGPPLASPQGAARNPEDVDRERREHEREERMGQLRGSATRALPPGPPTGTPANRLRSAAEPVASTPASRIQQAGEQGPGQRAEPTGGRAGRARTLRAASPCLTLQAILLPERSHGSTERGR